MKRWLALMVACLALGIVAAGCGGGDDNGDNGSSGGGGSSSSGSSGGSSPSSSSGGGGGAQVTMKDIKFSPSNVTVKTGGTVTWTNEDSVGHDVTGDGFKSGSAGDIQNGGTYKHTFDKAGTFKYVCTVHPGMEGTVTVK